jgi:hypothetical protein
MNQKTIDRAIERLSEPLTPGEQMAIEDYHKTEGMTEAELDARVMELMESRLARLPSSAFTALIGKVVERRKAHPLEIEREVQNESQRR